MPREWKPTHDTFDNRSAAENDAKRRRKDSINYGGLGPARVFAVRKLDNGKWTVMYKEGGFK